MILVLVFFSNMLQAQSDAVFEKLNNSIGLSQNIIYKIDQDKYHNLWLATEEGVVRCNSKDFTVYNKFNGFPEGLDERVLYVFVDSKSVVWIGTETGLGVYDVHKDRFHYIANQNNKPFAVLKIVEDYRGVKWVATYNGVWKCVWNGTKYVLSKAIRKINPKSLSSINSELIFADKKGVYALQLPKNTIHKKQVGLFDYASISFIKQIEASIFIGTMDGKLYKTDASFSKFKLLYAAPSQNPFPLKDIVSYKEHYYLGIDGGGIVIVDKNFQFLEQYTHNDDQVESLSNNSVYDLFVDQQNLLWVATYGGGINFFNFQKSNFSILKHQINDKNSLSNNYCLSFLEVAPNSIWVGTNEGISIWNKSNNTWKSINSLSTKFSEFIILSMALDGDTVWVSAYNQGLYKINKNTLKITPYVGSENSNTLHFKKIFKIFKDSNNAIWLGGADEKLVQITNQGQIKTYTIKNVKDILQSRSGTIYVGSKDGLFAILPNSTIPSAVDLSTESPKAAHYSITSLTENAAGELVIGTNGSGIIFFNPTTSQKRVLTTKEQLSSNLIKSIIEFQPKQYWVSTSKGLTLIKDQGRKFQIRNYSLDDGISSAVFNTNAKLALSNGELLFGGVDGITYFNPKNIISQKYLPNIVFEELAIDNEVVKIGSSLMPQHINETQHLTLPYQHNSFDIKFVAVLFGLSSNVKYSWMLEGLNSKWSNPSSQRIVEYENLSYGDYVFKVKATNKDGIWSKPRELKITIQRPWWASYIALFVYGVVIIMLIYFVIYFTKLIEIKKNKEEQVAMLNNISHEIKTPLSILISQIDNDPDKNKRSNLEPIIARLNNLIEQMLNLHLVVSSSEILEKVEKINIITYFQNCIHEFQPLIEDKNLSVEINAQNNAIQFCFWKESLDKIVQNLLSNAIKYSKLNGKIIIHLEVTSKGDLEFTIKDHGVGIPTNQQKYILNRYFRASNILNKRINGSGLGLMIVKNVIDKVKGEISFESIENIGTTFKVVLPNQEELYEMNSLEEEVTAAPEIDPIELRVFKDYCILVVEDNDLLRSSLVSLLERFFVVEQAVNGKEGLEKALSVYPNLIITDYMMPVMDGITMCSIIKEDINLNHIPIFMMTALHDTAHMQDTIESGITEYFEKPLNSNLLLAKINNVFQWQSKLKKKYLHEGEILQSDRFKSKKDSDFIEKLEKIVLDKIIDENFSLNDICMIIGMSRTSLYMKLKRLIDVSPQDFIIITKLQYAKKLLIEGNHNIKEAAFSCGFSNPKYFSTSFKKQFGITPTEFVKSLEKLN